jgi:hypothetical protein
MKRTAFILAALLLALPTFVHAAEPLPPMLNLPQAGQDPAKIDFARLPMLKGTRALVTQGDKEWHFRLGISEFRRSNRWQEDIKHE